jgi:hypothetical protein
MTGQCRNCGKRREVRRAQRFGAGSYNRAGRWYWSSICQDCADALLSGLPDGPRQPRKVGGWSVSALRAMGGVSTAEAGRNLQANTARAGVPFDVAATNLQHNVRAAYPAPMVRDIEAKRAAGAAGHEAHHAGLRDFHAKEAAKYNARAAELEQAGKARAAARMRKVAERNERKAAEQEAKRSEGYDGYQ